MLEKFLHETMCYDAQFYHDNGGHQAQQELSALIRDMSAMQRAINGAVREGVYAQDGYWWKQLSALAVDDSAIRDMEATAV